MAAKKPPHLRCVSSMRGSVNSPQQCLLMFAHTLFQNISDRFALHSGLFNRIYILIYARIIRTLMKLDASLWAGVAPMILFFRCPNSRKCLGLTLRTLAAHKEQCPYTPCINRHRGCQVCGGSGLRIVLGIRLELGGWFRASEVKVR